MKKYVVLLRWKKSGQAEKWSVFTARYEVDEIKPWDADQNGGQAEINLPVNLFGVDRCVAGYITGNEGFEPWVIYVDQDLLGININVFRKGD
jgi:hypothetical protein